MHTRPRNRHSVKRLIIGPLDENTIALESYDRHARARSRTIAGDKPEC